MSFQGPTKSHLFCHFGVILWLDSNGFQIVLPFLATKRREGLREGCGLNCPDVISNLPKILNAVSTQANCGLDARPALKLFMPGFTQAVG